MNVKNLYTSRSVDNDVVKLYEEKTETKKLGERDKYGMFKL